MKRFILRIFGGCAVAGFGLGGLHAVWKTLADGSVTELEASGSGWSHELMLIAQSAALEGVGFGLLGLLLGALAAAVTIARRGSSVEHACALVLLMAGALEAFLWVTPHADSLLPLLTPSALTLLNVVGIAVSVAVLALFRTLVGWLPWTPREAPACVTVGSLAAFFAAYWAGLSILFGEETVATEPSKLGLVAGLFLLALPVASLGARLVRPLVAILAEELARGPLLPRVVNRFLVIGLVACALGTAPFVRLSFGASPANYTRLPSRDSRAAGPNVVLVTIDTLRADHLGCYGYERPTSPFLDSLAAAGTRFADPVASATWTKPATGTILTGLYPSRHGGIYHGSELRLPEGEQTLAEAFRERGYVTAGFVSNGHVKRVFGFDRGFETFFDAPIEDTVTRASIRQTFFGRILVKLLRDDFNWLFKTDVRRMNAQVRAWLAANHDQPFFIYVHYLDPHIPYDPAPELRRQFEQDHGLVFHKERMSLVGQDLYDAEILYTDGGIRELVEELEARGVWENTLFVLTSDHGEEFLEHGVLGHGYNLFQQTLRVPLIFHGPGVPAGHVVEQPVQILDLAATLQELTGGPTDGFGDGHSFAGSLHDPLWSSEAEYFLENEFGKDVSAAREFVLTGVRAGPWKLVLTEHDANVSRADPAFLPEALYDLSRDPAEETNLIATEEHREIAAGLLQKLRAHSEFLFETGFRDIEPAALSPEMEASLRALGYF